VAALHSFARGAVLFAMVLGASPAHAQSEAGSKIPEKPSKLRILLGTEAILHATDMFTTAHNLQHGGVEANPVLAPLSGNPLALVTLSSGINVLQIYTIAKLHKRHPKVAMAWALILVGVESYAVTNNIRVHGQLQRAHAGTR
jgi:hypothetical protein